MDNSIKIAKELVRIAKSLTAGSCSFSWNENATDFSSLDFYADVDGDEYKITDFDIWLKSNFPQEYLTLSNLSESEMFGNGFESFVINSMYSSDRGYREGIYPVDIYSPLILFGNAKNYKNGCQKQ